MKNKRIAFLVVSFCFYLFATSFIGTIGAPVTVYADGDPIDPPYEDTIPGPKSLDTTSTDFEENRQENEMSILDMLFWLATIKI